MITNKQYKEDMRLLILGLNHCIQFLPINGRKGLYEPLVALSLRIQAVPDHEHTKYSGELDWPLEDGGEPANTQEADIALAPVIIKGDPDIEADLNH